MRPLGVIAEICALISACMSLLSSFDWVAVGRVLIGLLVFPFLVVSFSRGLIFGRLIVVWEGAVFCGAVVSFLFGIRLSVSLG